MSSGIDVRIDGWDIRGRWFGVVVGATPRLGKLRRGQTIPWRVLAAQIAPHRKPQLALTRWSLAMTGRSTSPRLTQRYCEFWRLNQSSSRPDHRKLMKEIIGRGLGL